MNFMNGNKPVAVFYCNDKISHIHSMEYYNQDIKALEFIGYNVIVVNNIFKIPFKFDIIFIWWWSYALIPVILSKIFKKKSFITGAFNFLEQKSIPNSGFLNRPFYQRILIKFAFRLADYNLIVGKNEFNQLKFYFGTNNIFYFPHCVGDDYFQNYNSTASRSDLLCIAWSGKNNLIRKGIYDIIDAIEILKNEGIKIKFIFGGHKGDGYDNLLDYIRNKQLSEHIVLVGELSKLEKISLMSKALIYLQPSHYEGFGVAAAEALALGSCVLTCDVGEVRNVLGDGAYYVNPGDSKSLADAIIYLIENNEVRESLVKFGQSQLKRDYSFKAKSFLLNNLIKNE
jgi:glycosyltransferase involved in cell wall biosynthesis